MSDEYTIFEIVGKIQMRVGMNARDIYERNKRKPRNVTIEQAFEMLGEGYAFFPLWGKVDGGVVMDYAFFGLKIAFIHYRVYKDFKKALEDYMGGSEEPDGDDAGGLF